MMMEELHGARSMVDREDSVCQKRFPAARPCAQLSPPAMSKPRKSTIEVQGAVITILTRKEQDFISLTDMAKKFGDDSLIYGWMRNRNTVQFLGIWEQIHNPDFKGGGFETFKAQAGLNSFHLTPRKWIDATAAIGLQSRAGRYGGGTKTLPVRKEK